MKRLLSILFTLLVALGATAQRVNEAAVKRQINAAASRIRTMQCDFVQTKHMRMLNDKMVSKGVMYYAQPNKLRWQYTSPYTYTFVLSGSQVMMNKGKKSQVIDVSQSKVFKEITRIMMNSVVGKCLTDGNDFKSAIADGKTEWIVTLTPLKKNMKQMFSSIKVRFNKQRSMVSAVELYEKNGDRTVIELSNVRTNISLNAQLFSVK